MVSNLLNKLKWTNKLKNCEIIILHRGAPDNKRTILGSKLTELKKSYFCYKSDDEEIFIPMHRILEVRLGNKTVWKRKSKL